MLENGKTEEFERKIEQDQNTMTAKDSLVAEINEKITAINAEIAGMKKISPVNPTQLQAVSSSSPHLLTNPQIKEALKEEMAQLKLQLNVESKENVKHLQELQDEVNKSRERLKELTVV